MALPAIAFAVVGVLTFANTSDDPLITLRYAYNLLHHGQPVFNRGEHVEGYSSPLHLLIATIVLVLPGGFELLKLKLVSLAFGAGTIWQTHPLARALQLPPWAGAAVLVAVAGSFNFVISSGNGLETSVTAFLVTGTVVSLTNAQGDWRGAAAWGALLALARPDALLVIALLGVVSLARRSDGHWWQRTRWLIGPIATFAALEGFRIAYYHALVPNTYFAKQLSLSASLLGGAGYLLNSQPLAQYGVGIVVLILEAWLVTIGLRRFLRARPAVGYAAAVVVAETVFVFSSGGDWMRGGRFFAPALPAGTALVFLGVEAFVASVRSSQRRVAGAIVGGLALAILAFPSHGNDLAPAWRLTSGVGDRALIAQGNYRLSPIWAGAVALANCLRDGETVAYSEVGLFGFEHLGLRVIDTRGLTDAEIARAAPASEKHQSGVQDNHWYVPSSAVGRILFRRRPDMIISFDRPAGTVPGAAILGGLYTRAALIAEPRAYSPLLVYVRRGVTCAV